jgi:hypothetical protein|uniref:Uncharacterized protein n=1 Tax=Siphoviridae sp. ctqwY3 TaxID=2827951 RepID=A0A8S5S733_9CAUD|nr:MAG TPA: hypothetical protein [Siphoviridae sp. ctqwY3]
MAKNLIDSTDIVRNITTDNVSLMLSDEVNAKFNNAIPFVLKINRAGLNVDITNGSMLNLLTLVSLSDVVNDITIPKSSYDLTNGVLKMPSLNQYVDYLITVTLTGTIAGPVSTAREFKISLARGDNTVLREQAIIKVADNTLSARSVNISTFANLLSDLFITMGIKLNLINDSGQTINLTGVEIIIKGVR